MNNPIKFTFLKPGMLTLVVDNGQLGYQKYGVPVGGAMDSESAKTANWLVGNAPDNAVFEINLIGPKIRFNNDCQIAITGANISPSINSIKVNMNKTLSLKKGALLEFGKLIHGSRSYVGVRGTWKILNEIKTAKQSKSSTLKRLNEIEIIQPKEVLPVRKKSIGWGSRNQVNIHVMKGPEFNLLSKKAQQSLLGTFKLLPASNRMGYRLTPSLPKLDVSIISSGVVPGTLQITQDGSPILIMQDGPATGGYARVLNVVSEDISKLGQLKAGDSFTFKIVNN